MNAPRVTFDAVKAAVMATPSGVYVKALELSRGESWRYSLVVEFDDKWDLDHASRGRVLFSFQEAVNRVVPDMYLVHVVERV